MKLSKASYLAAAQSRYADNGVGVIDASIDRDDRQDLADSVGFLDDDNHWTGDDFHSGNETFGASALFTNHLTFQSADYSGAATLRFEDVNTHNRRFERLYGNSFSYTADATSDVGIFDTSDVPNNSIIVLFIHVGGIKSDGANGFGVYIKSTWRKASGSITKIGDTTLDQQEDAAGTLTHSTLASGTVIQHRVVSAGGSGSYKYGIWVDLLLYSYT